MSIFSIRIRDFLFSSLGVGMFLFVGCSFNSNKEPPQTLHLVIHEKIKGLDPIYADDQYSSAQVSQAYETLVQYHYLKRPYVLVPNLAASLPEVSSDGLTYKFHLKSGVFFQDDPAFKSSAGKGREMTAEDVIYSLKRLADPKLFSTGWWILDGKVAGLNEWREKALRSGNTDYSDPVEGLVALDSKTVQIKLVHRSSQFLYLMAMPFAAVVPHEAVDFYGKEFQAHAVGTGPFRLELYQPNAKIVWVRNPKYRLETYPSEGEASDKHMDLLEDAGKSLPLSDRVVFDVMVEQQPTWLNFLSGKIDIASIPKDNFASAITKKRELSPELSEKGIRLVKGPGVDVTHASFNMSDPLFGKNKYLRQALSMAYDEATFIELFFNGQATPAQGPIPPGILGFDEKLKNPYRKFSLEKAKELLALAGFPGGKGLPAIEYATLAGSAGRQQGEYFQKMMSVLGVTIHVSSYAWPQFMEAIRTGKAQIWEYAWSADYPDAENFLQLFYSKNTSPGPNDSNYSNPEFDRLYEKTLLLPEGQEKANLYSKMVGMLVEDCPWIFGAHRLNYVVVQPWLKNFKLNNFDHNRYKYYRVETKAKGKA